MSALTQRSHSPPTRKNTKHACDGCKIRKIKCTGERSPCGGCVAAGIECTWKVKAGKRGPRTLRERTLREIKRRTNGQERGEVGSRDGVVRSRYDEEVGSVATGYIDEDANLIREEVMGSMESTEHHHRASRISLVARLHDYHQRLFPVWPIVDINTLILALETPRLNPLSYALAYAIGAATIAQLKLPSTGEDVLMEAECQYLRNAQVSSSATLTSLRIPFFLHVYHENLQAGGTKSLLYLRETLTLAQIMGLHRESTYANFPPGEQQLRRRIIWLLFVTERGVAMLHKLPVILKPNTLFPSTYESESQDESRVLPAFCKLASLFWIFDQSGAFDILQNEDSTMLSTGAHSADRRLLEDLQTRLQDVSGEREQGNDTQRADICVTRSWMRAVLWRASMHRGTMSPTESPVTIARDFLAAISRVPKSAMEAHGPSMELKIFEIANAVMDTMSPHGNSQDWPPRSFSSPTDIVNHLRQLLISFRGGNKTLIARLGDRVVEVQGPPAILLEPSLSIADISNWPRDGFSDEDGGVPAENLARMPSPSHLDTFSNANKQRGMSEALGDQIVFTQHAFQDSGSLVWDTELLTSLQQLGPMLSMRDDDDGFG